MALNTKKIAIICNYKLLPERVGGMDYFFWAFDKKCKENNVEIQWFFPNTSNQGDYSFLNIISPDADIALETFVLQTIQGQYDVVFTHFLELCTSFYCQLKKKTEAKIIAVDHNPRPLGGYPVKKRLKKRLKGWLFSRCIDQFIGVSKYTTNEILQDFGSHLKTKTSVVYNGIIINDIKPNLKRNITHPKFLVVSHLRASKGIQDLIDAVNLLSDAIKENLKIDIYGEGPYESELKKKISQFKLQTVFNFKGSVSNLNELYCLYDYMLQPTHMECFSLSILESLAANVPVITTNVGGNEEAVKHEENGYIFNARDISELKDIIESVFLGEKQIKINTRTAIEDSFSIKNMVENYFKLIS
ncbi:glycosyltransferase family 4 protein [Seonamhaeicola algicola]|uniref:Glycosyltransferase family 4 protein n=1 Tax=Seonamhaeicola algicola TaxID=1719036 RepID=A0A5C7B036_9FLAO|nr:glycosyltransferase family 4 protein [Seonamhaeicola algicola]TXE12025.1 glycosyltransferase family 4 protein [Seonamhaeicola algicola]